MWDILRNYWVHLTTLGALVGPILSGITIIYVLVTKKNSTSAVAWCLLVIFLPLLGPFLFLLFGYQHVNRPLSRKRRHKQRFQRKPAAAPAEAFPGTARAAGAPSDFDRSTDGKADVLARLARRFGAQPATGGNQIAFYEAGESAFAAMFEAIRSARHHIHLEYFIFQPDATGRLFLDALTQKAREGVQVRLLYDAMGSRRLHRWRLWRLGRAGGKYSVFLPLNPLRRRIQVNMRNHRKILVVDGRVAFTGGLNIGDEYLGKDPRYGFWRDTHLRMEGPAVAELQSVFAEDWDFAANETLQDPTYFPAPSSDGPYTVQVIQSGPDREQKGIREMYFAAILHAQQRVWIATPYFVPDAGLLDALCLAGSLGVDVRLLCQYHPDKWIPFFAGRYYWGDVLNAGVKVYQYTKGMLHSKVVLVDGEWASVGTANLDMRSLYLNFEVNCLIYSAQAVAELEAAFQRDLAAAIRLERHVFAHRPFAGQLIDNACRLLSPVL
ncbi:MAG TPA: cardiolipin synthase [Gemmataceae bacterium]|nr:cardiolipin synthase [Gemmataceae bacterium]